MSRRSFSVGGIGGGGSVVGRHGDFVRWRRGQRSEVLEALVPSACLLDSVLDTSTATTPRHVSLFLRGNARRGLRCCCGRC